MFDPRFKIISSFVGREQGVALVEEYDRKSLNPNYKVANKPLCW